MKKPDKNLHEQNKDQTHHKDNMTKNKIIQYLDQGDWKMIMRLINNREFTDLNMEIDNGNNLFHLACVKGQTDVIKEMISLKKDHKIRLNTGLLNNDGVPGIHLYYKYGGSDATFFDSDDICYIDSDSKMLILYLINRIDLLEILVDKIIKRGCIDNTELPDTDYIYYELIKKIIEFSTTDKNKTTRYLAILRSIWLEIMSSNLVFVAIYMNSIDVIKMVMMEKYDFMVYSSGKITPLIKAVDKGHIEIALMIMEYTKRTCGNYDVYKMIHASEKEFSFRPIFIALMNNHISIIKIMVEYMVPYLNDYCQTHKTRIRFTNEIDSHHNTYLHKILTSKYLPNISTQIIRFFIEHTDLNQENYAGVTVAHILFGKGLWMHYKDLLIGREIDMLKIDDMGNNCYSYIAEKDKDDFFKFSQHIKIPIHIKDSQEVQKMFNTDTIKSMIKISEQSAPKGHENADINNIRSKNYGLFNANMTHYMLYLRYLENKHKTMYVPVRIFSQKLKERDIFLFDLMAYNTSPKQQLLNKQVKSYLYDMYSYLPHNIYWIDQDQNYIDVDLIPLLKMHNKTVSVTDQRYVMLKITIIVSESLLHANALIYDRLHREAWRFEPYGITKLLPGVSLMDNKLHEILEKVYGKIIYHDPDDYLHGLNFQLVDGEEFVANRNLGDPVGYCLAWSMWFIDVVISHPDKNVRDIMRNFFDRHSISQILSEEEGHDEEIKSNNYYLDFIRRYAHKLDDEKNKILLSMGVKKYYLYNSVMKDDVHDKITNMFMINPQNDTVMSDQFQEIRDAKTIHNISDI
jgi:hypothetical protein